MPINNSKQLPSQNYPVINKETGRMEGVWWQFFFSFAANALNISGNGVVVATSGGLQARVITGTANQIAITNGNGQSGNPTIAISNTYAGQATIVTVGTITSGLWNATQIGEIYGGTNQTTYVTGDTLYSSSSNTLSKLAGNTTTTTKYLQQIGTGAASQAPTWSQVSLTAGVTGVLPTANGGVSATSFSSFTPTVTGFSGSPTVTGFQKSVGKTVFVRLTVSGTSNTTTFTITNLPTTSATSTDQTVGIFLATDSGTATSATGIIAANGTTLTLQKGITSSGAWTNTGTKEVFCNFWYETT